MPSVVCPACGAGFEAQISQNNYTLNCVTCGVAFNAAAFLPKAGVSAKRGLASVLVASATPPAKLKTEVIKTAVPEALKDASATQPKQTTKLRGLALLLQTTTTIPALPDEPEKPTVLTPVAEAPKAEPIPVQPEVHKAEPVHVPPQPQKQQVATWTLSRQKQFILLAGAAVAAVVLMMVGLSFAFGKPKDPLALTETAYTIMNDRTQPDRFAKAERLFREATGLKDTLAQAHMGLGLSIAWQKLGRAGQGKPDEQPLLEATNEINRAVTLDPQLQAEGYYQLSRFDFQLNNYKGEIDKLEKAVRLSPSALKYQEALGMAYWYRGREVNARELYERAEAEFQQILNTDKDYPRVRDYIKTLQAQFLLHATVSNVN